ncbi:MAG: calcium/proton exchanger [Isosphaeraceae bacterium]
MTQGRVNVRGEGVHVARWTDWIDPRQVGWVRLLVVFIPITAGAEWFGAPAIAVFLTAGLAIIPLAGLIGESTEALSCRVGPGLGGLLNATFGNAAELIIALFALAKGLDGVVKASLTGSIIGNLLLVLGASLLAGGLRYPYQRFNRTAASSGTTLMVLAASGMILPALFHELVAADADYAEHNLSLGVSLILMITYGLSLLFSLKTHRELYNPEGDTVEEALHGAAWGIRKSTIVLLAATALVAWMSEVLVGAVEEASHALGLTEVFVGVIIVAIVGNAAEHSTAVIMAWKNQTDLALGIAMGSALQIALFVAPVLVFCSYLRAEPMDLLFTPMEVAAVILAVFLARMVVEDGESNWLEGAMLLMIYAILGVAFFFLPARHRSAFSDPIPAAAEVSPRPVSAPETR